MHVFANMSSNANDPIQKALSSLLPSSTIPPRLVRSTQSLLSLSRQRASHLKPDEEIARAHVCAEIACKRLRVQLRLPSIRSGNGAPCRPNVYKKLLSFLDKTLEDVDVLGTPQKSKDGPTRSQRTPGTGKSTGRKRNVDALTTADNEEVEVETPTKRRKITMLDPLATPTKSSGKKPNGFTGRIQVSTGKSRQTAEAPAYVLPAVRKLCRAFKTPKMVPHVYTGICVVLDLAGVWPVALDDLDLPSTHEEDVTQNILSSTIALYLLTLTRMQKGLMTTEVYDTVSSRGIETLDLEGERVAVQSHIEQWITRVNDEEWTSQHGKGQEWWLSVPEDVLNPLKLPSVQGSIETEHEETDEGHVDVLGKPNTRHKSYVSRRDEIKKQLEEEDPENVLLPGLGTMVNDAVDYFSEEKTAEFERWKAEVFRQMDAIEKGGGRKGRAVATAA